MSDPQTTPNEQEATDIAVRIVEQSHMHYLRKEDWGSENFKAWIQAALDAAYKRGFNACDCGR